MVQMVDKAESSCGMREDIEARGLFIWWVVQLWQSANSILLRVLGHLGPCNSPIIGQPWGSPSNA